MGIIEFSQYQVQNAALIFCRICGVLFFMPGSSFVPTRVKTFFAVVCALFAASIVELKVVNFVLQAFLESLVGVIVGMILAVLFSAINVAGNIMVFQSGLMYAALSDANQELGGNLVKFLTLLVMLILIVSGIHLALLSFVIDSYNYIKPYEFLFANDALPMLTEVARDSFVLALKIASPVLVIGSFLYFCSGLINRLIPSVQAFFIIAPLQIWVSMIVLALILAEITTYAANFILNYIDQLYR